MSRFGTQTNCLRKDTTVVQDEIDKPLPGAEKNVWQRLANEHPDRDLHLGAVNVLSRFARLEKYIDIAEAQMEEFQRIEQMSLGETGDCEQDEMEWRNHFYEFDEHFVPTLRYSLLVMVHMLIERGLGECCEWVKDRHGSTIFHRDLKGSPVEQCTKFVERISGFQLATINGWEKIARGQQVRNCVVHTLGETEALSPEQKRVIEQICKNESGLSIEDYGRLKVDFVYAKNQIQHAKKFFEELFKRLGFQCRPSTS